MRAAPLLVLVLLSGCASSAPPRCVERGTTPIAAADPAPPAPPPGNADPDAARPEDRAQLAAPRAAPVVEEAPRFMPDGRSVAFLASPDGARGLWVQELTAGAAARRIASVPPRFRRPVPSPDGRALYFTSDSGGDEAFAIRRLELASGALEDVAVGDGLRRDGPWPVAGGAKLLFTARPMTARGLALYERDAAGGAAPRQVLADETVSLAAVRSDGAEVLVVRAPLEDALSAVDLASSTRRALYPLGAPPGAGAIRIHDAVYAPDGRTVYVATDAGGERTHVIALDARTGRERARHTEPRAPGGEVQGLCAAGGVVAFVLDLGTHHELRVLDARTLRPRVAPALPLGSEVPGAKHPNQTGGLSLSPDGTHLAVQWSTPSSPPRIQIVDTRTGAVTPLTAAAPTPTDAIDATVVSIPSFDGLAIPALVYGVAGAHRRPVVVSIHGGFAYASTARFDPQLAAFVAAGYAVVEPNVRGSAGSGPAYERADDGPRKLEAVRDFRAVGEWIAAQPWADAQRLVLMGGSAGGYYTLMALAHQPALWRAGVVAVPLYDLAEALGAMDGDLRAFLGHELGPVTEPALLSALSPSTYVDRIRAPVFVYAGANDVRTPIAQIDHLVRDLRARGRTVEYMRVEGQGHTRGDPRTQAERLVRTLRFLGEALR